jgi:anti-sigma factor RsiW
MPQTSAVHLSEEQLEKYLLQQVSEADAAAVEEHLLVCAHCQTQLEELETFTKTFRAVAPILAREDAEPQQAGIMDWLRQQLRNPLPALAFGAAAAIVVFLTPLAWRNPAVSGPAVTLELEAVRAATVPQAPPARPLILRLDVDGLTRATSYRAELATNNGATLLTRAVAPSSGKATMEVPEGLSAGRYWLRLYGPDHAEPIREFGFAIR